MRVSAENITQLPIPLDEIHDFLWISDEHSRDLDMRAISAVEELEKEMRRAIVKREHTVVVDSHDGEIVLPRPPHHEVLSAEGADGSVDYDVTGIDRLTVKAQERPVKITFIAGYENMPHDIKLAVLRLMKHHFENRDDVVSGATGLRIPENTQTIVRRWKVY